MCRADQVGARTGDTVPAEGEAPRFTQEQLESWSGQLEFAAQLGLRTVASVLVTGAEPDRQAISRLTPPLVVKALPNRVQHKTDLGLVTTGLADTDAACDAVRRLRTRLDADVPIVVQEHAHGVEVLLSMSSDADWGPVLTLGAGGVAVELTGDLIFLPAPSPTERVERAVSRARLGTMLRGYRGAPPADIDALLVAAERLQRVYLASDLAEIELNPLVVAPRGRGAYMIDLLTSENEPRASR
jgi:succinyl-CoA synthetase beta subunit